MESLSEDSIYDYFQNLDYPDIVQLCQSNRYFRQLCQTERFIQVINEKKKYVIPIKPVSTTYLTAFAAITGKRLTALIEAPIRGNLVEINKNLYVVTGQLKAPFDRYDPTILMRNYISRFSILPVNKIVREYAIIDSFESSKYIKIAEVAGETLKWKAGIYRVKFL